MFLSRFALLVGAVIVRDANDKRKIRRRTVKLLRRNAIEYLGLYIGKLVDEGTWMLLVRRPIRDLSTMRKSEAAVVLHRGGHPFARVHGERRPFLLLTHVHEEVELRIGGDCQGVRIELGEASEKSSRWS